MSYLYIYSHTLERDKERERKRFLGNALNGKVPEQGPIGRGQ